MKWLLVAIIVIKSWTVVMEDDYGYLLLDDNGGPFVTELKDLPCEDNRWLGK